MDDYPGSIYDAIVLCNGNVEIAGNISYIPIYMIMFVKPAESNIGVYKIDLSGLTF